VCVCVCVCACASVSGKFAVLYKNSGCRYGVYQGVLVVVYRRFGAALRSRNVDKEIEERTSLFRLA
jgi:hypothetical protein